MVTIPRVVIAAPASGQGKTSIATGLLAAFRNRGFQVSPHKVGPDYIDPGYHTLAAGRPGRNLDPWLVGEHRIVSMFAHGASTPIPADIAVVEGVMGLFDGASGHGEFASTAHVAKILDAPVILVVDAAGVARSVAALVHGFLTYDPGVRIGGVIFNRVGSPAHEQLLRDALHPMGVPVLGAVRRRDSLAVPSRHLGLVPAAERSVAALAVVAELGAVVAESVDLEAVLRLARGASALIAADEQPDASTPPDRPIRIAVASGAAFTFGYAEHVELLEAAGAEVVPVDPLCDEHLPADIDGLIVGGGFPEVHAVELTANDGLRADIARAAAAGVPMVAECAGLLYLGKTLDGHPMCGVLDSDAVMTDTLVLGYRDAVCAADSPLAAQGTRVHGHEFHRTVVTRSSEVTPAWHWQVRGTVVSEGAVRASVHASYLHVHWSGLPGAAQRLVAACSAPSLRGRR
jgi:cobyrinic acid a,c-diamide synthase